MAHEHEGHPRGSATAVIEVGGLHWGSEKVIEAVLGRRPGVLAVDANPVAQTATVTYDPTRTAVVDLRNWVRNCGYHCEGQSVPSHICDPLMEPTPPGPAVNDDRPTHDPPAGESTAGAGPAPDAHAGHDDTPAQSSHEAMGHGGSHAGMSMAAMVTAMRRRFVLAAVFSVPILLWSRSVGTSSASTWPPLSVCATTPSSYFCPFP